MPTNTELRLCKTLIITITKVFSCWFKKSKLHDMRPVCLDPEDLETDRDLEASRS